jgi:hypothetical protein
MSTDDVVCSDDVVISRLGLNELKQMRNWWDMMVMMPISCTIIGWPWIILDFNGSRDNLPSGMGQIYPAGSDYPLDDKNASQTRLPQLTNACRARLPRVDKRLPGQTVPGWQKTLPGPDCPILDILTFDQSDDILVITISHHWPIHLERQDKHRKWIKNFRNKWRDKPHAASLVPS